MTSILDIIQVVISLALIPAILLQQRGGGLSAAFGGDGSAYRTRRGVERGVFVASVILSVLFFATAILNILLR